MLSLLIVVSFVTLAFANSTIFIVDASTFRSFIKQKYSSMWQNNDWESGLLSQTVLNFEYVYQNQYYVCLKLDMK